MDDFLIRYWPILLPTVLGAVAVYWLLPRAQRLPPVYGAVFAGLALVAAGMLLIHSDWAPVEAILFYTFAGLAIGFGGLMITQRNPVHAALSFAMVVLSTCGLFLLQAAPFLMAATIVVYAGAIIVTFLFVIMLAQQAGISSADQRSREPFLSTIAGFVLLGSLFFVLQSSYSGIDYFVEKTERASEASTVSDWQKILGNDDTFFTQFRTTVLRTLEGRRLDPSEQAAARQALASAIDEAQPTWNAIRSGGQGAVQAEKEKQFKENLAVISKLSSIVQQRMGTLQPAFELPLSSNSGVPANAIIERDQDGKPKERLPAANVAGLGKSLFTDNLLAVELAGTLLLVATIGAIAIAGRRPEGLR